MSIQSKAENLLNYITGSAGGWPNNTHIGIMAGVDYIKETGSDDIYFNEMNTNVGIFGSLSKQQTMFNLISDYAVSQSCNTAYVYGTSHLKTNPSTFQQTKISESFARHDIPVNFEYQDNVSHTYFSQRGDDDYTGSFHLFMQTPWYSDDNLYDIVSSSFDKSKFRSVLDASPESASLVPLFNTSSFTASSKFPEYVIKIPTAHGSIGENQIKFRKYQSGTTTYQNAIDSGSLTESYIVSSGSYRDGKAYLHQNKFYFLMTPTGHIMLDHLDNNTTPEFLLSGSEDWNFKPTGQATTASGSVIHMYDGSTKQVQDVQVGDVVKSFLPSGMTDDSAGGMWVDYTTSSLTGSLSGSVVLSIKSFENYGYYLVNGSIKVPATTQIKYESAKYFVKSSGTWGWKKVSEISNGDYFLNSSEDEVEITSKAAITGSETFYALDVEDIDTYFQSDILVHNIPGKE